MVQEGENVKVVLSYESLQVFRLMGENEPWFQDQSARVKELVYEHFDRFDSITERFWRVQFLNNCGTQIVVSEKDLYPV